MYVLSQRVQLMKENFITMHTQGYSILEIADKFHLSDCTVYSHLQEIADENNVSRESLLRFPHKPHTTYEHIHRDKDEDVVNPQDMETLYKNANDKILAILEQIALKLEGEK